MNPGSSSLGVLEPTVKIVALAIHDAPDQGRTGALVVADQNVGGRSSRATGSRDERRGIQPRSSGMPPDNLEVPEHGVECAGARSRRLAGWHTH